MKEIKINQKKYQIIKDEKEAINLDVLEEKITEFYDDFDYIIGDWSYGKLRLKGFNEKGNKNLKTINDIGNLDKYLKNNCAYGCKWFQIKRIRD